MCSNVNQPGHIRITDNTYFLLSDNKCTFERETLNIKGKGKMETLTDKSAYLAVCSDRSCSLLLISGSHRFHILLFLKTVSLKIF